jgi:hypothetical protein
MRVTGHFTTLLSFFGFAQFAGTQMVTRREARAIAAEAYLYGFPLVENYKTLYAQAVARGGANFKAPFNQIGNTANVFTPKDTAIITPNSDTPYSFVWMDLRAEPVVLTLPEVEEARYYSVQLIDLYTHNFAYLGKRTTGSKGGSFLIAGPAWRGEKPVGVAEVVRCETEFAYALYRTQLFGPDDLGKVKRVQSGYRVRTLGAFLGRPAPALAPAVDWPMPEPDTMTQTPAIFRYLNFVLGFAPTVPSETGLMARFARIGVGAGLPFEETKLSAGLRKALEDGIADGVKKFQAFKTAEIDTRKVSSADLFGTRAYLGNNYLRRYAGAKLGIYGNSGEEAIYPAYFVDADGAPLDAARNRYVLEFDNGKLPPADAFWSVTMYDGRTQLLVDNRLGRYLINSPMLPQLKTDSGGGLTLYVQHESPGAALESNWLPAPAGPFYAVMRIYMPKPEVRSGAWKEPPLRIVTAAAAAARAPAAAPAAPASASSLRTPVGAIPLSLGLPADRAARQKLYDELDFQRACQAYLWALPIVSFATWQNAARTAFGAGDTDMVIYESIRDKLGILTANATTPYILGLPDLSNTGPLVIDYPAGATAGGVGDSWQRPVTDMGETGPDQGQGGKYLILGPGQKAVGASGYRVMKSPTNNILVGFRVLDPDPETGRQLVARFRMYPYGARKTPAPTRLIRPDGRAWSQVPPHGLAYFERLDEILQREPVMERDRMMMAMLKPLGIEKGIAFQPDARQQQILEDGARMGEMMAQTKSFDKREKEALYRPDTRWLHVILLDPSQETESYSQLDERADYFYEAVTTTKGMVSTTPGVGQAYLGAYQDNAGNWFDGGEAYRLRVPADPPAKLFWSLTIYDSLSRVLIDNGKDIADRSSRADLLKNPDGSVDIYAGPTAPAGFEKNWIPTVPGKAWFAYFRLYGPLQAYFDRSWKLPDIERTN